jgi:hypothetical protein
MLEGTPTLQTGPQPGEAAASHHEGSVGRVLHAVGHVVAEGAHIVVGAGKETVSVLSMKQFSPRAEESVANASVDRLSEEARMNTKKAMAGNHPTWI